MTSPRPKISVLFCAMCLSLLLNACGGGGGGSAALPEPQAAPETGELLVGITDAEGDFVAYEVDVRSLELHRANGDTVQALPLSTRIDFTELTEVTELLTLATVPAGNYTSVTVELDYSNALVLVQDDTGVVAQAQLQDSSGQPLGVMDVRLSLTTTDEIRIAPGRPAAFSLDFDLDASNSIDFSTTPATVSVEPFLLAMPELETDRAHRLRGVLDAVAIDASTFALKVRPFHHRTGNFGLVRVETNADTQYEIDGEGYTGVPGLDAMAALAENTPVLAGIKITDDGLAANTVLAGSSVPWADTDAVKGIVTARQGNLLTVRGARVEFADGNRVYRGEQQILLGEGTTVTALGKDNADLSINSISVGQRIVAFGEVVDDMTLNAEEGRVRMLANQLTASVNTANPLVVDLFYLNGRRPGAFDFSGTGATADQDADPDAYEISVAGLDTTGFDPADLIRVRGLVNDFGMASPDFNATTLIDVADDLRRASLGVVWPEGTVAPFLSVAPARLEVDLSEARSKLTQQGIPRNFANPLEMLALIAPESGTGAYAVALRGDGEIHLYREFSDLVDALNRQLEAGNLLHHIAAHGRYNAAQEDFTTGRAVFAFRAASSN